MKIVPKAENCV